MIVITAASGRLGRAVAQELAELVGPSELRLAARSTHKLADFAERGFEVVNADYDDEQSMELAFAGAELTLLISGDAPNDVRIRQHRNAIDAAIAAGVERIVYTSVVNPTPASHFPFAEVHADTEAHLRAAGVAYTILRDNLYAANLDPALIQSRETGVIASPAAEAKVAYVTHADVAAASVGALLGEGHERKTYEITGGFAADYHDIAAALSAARGSEVHAVTGVPEEFRAAFEAMHMPTYLIEAVLGGYEAALAGEYAEVSDDVETLAGRPAQSVLDYVRQFA
jgi:NAD(P)H dehydrogenase (quinone)